MYRLQLREDEIFAFGLYIARSFPPAVTPLFPALVFCAGRLLRYNPVWM
jgi:hypothetical protein